jgi:hypothetical protein
MSRGIEHYMPVKQQEVRGISSVKILRVGELPQLKKWI